MILKVIVTNRSNLLILKFNECIATRPHLVFIEPMGDVIDVNQESVLLL